MRIGNIPKRNLLSQCVGLVERILPVPAREPEAALRLACYLGALALFSAMTVLRYLRVTVVTPVYSLLVVTFLVLALALLFLACRSTVPRPLRVLFPYSRALLALGLAGTLWASTYSLVAIARYPGTLARPEHYWNDAVAMTDCSTDLFLRGHNPYASFSLGDCFARLHMDGRFTTPLRAGAFAGTAYPRHDVIRSLFDVARQGHVQHPAEFESYVSYPSGSFLLPALFYALGWRELSSFNIAWIIAAYLLLAWRAPPRLRPWLAPIALANVVVWDYAIHGYSEGLVVFLTLAAWVARRRPWLSAVLMGLAVTTRQDSWFFALFYAVLIVRTEGWRDAARRVAVMAAIFSATNVPFFVQSPAAWLDGVLGPVRDPMYQGGQGLVVLVLGGWLPLWPRPVYTGLELSALALCAGVYARICRRHPGTGFVLALVPLVLAWRSLFVYFYLPLPILCLWPLVEDARARGPRVLAARPGGGAPPVWGRRKVPAMTYPSDAPAGSVVPAARRVD